jgi:hypothetical protein
MTGKEKARPHATPEALRAAREREERLAAALRANLARRKAQTRQREAAPPEKKA